ncbi:hypothetical protein GCM10017744_041080 [Streptomyces antimycoticus]
MLALVGAVRKRLAVLLALTGEPLLQIGGPVRLIRRVEPLDGLPDVLGGDGRAVLVLQPVLEGVRPGAAAVGGLAGVGGEVADQLGLARLVVELVVRQRPVVEGLRDQLIADVDLPRVQMLEGVPLQHRDGAALLGARQVLGRPGGVGGGAEGDVLGLHLGLVRPLGVRAAATAAAPRERQGARGQGDGVGTGSATVLLRCHRGHCTCLIGRKTCRSLPWALRPPGHRVVFGSIASRTESPSRLKATTKTTMAMPGKNM